MSDLILLIALLESIFHQFVDVRQIEVMDARRIVR